ncbi:MAG: S8 family peptidase [Paludibacteraceae bacterium]|nr:S8 family peptidase [Paludibacteraceae bacterium]
MRKITLLALCIGFTLLAFAQPSKLTNHTRAFVDAQKKATTAEQREQLRKTFALKVADNEEEYVSAYVHFYSADSDKAAILEAYGATLNNDFGDFVTSNIPVDAIEALAQDEQVKLVEMGTPVRTRMNKARTATNVDKVQAGTGLSQPFLGTGVVVGVVDGGFQYNHITFYDANNSSELRVKRVWNQSANKKYTTQSAIESAQYDDPSDNTGHATHVTGIAAGSYAGNSYYGVASDADIVMVSMGTGDNDVIDGVNYIFDYAKSVGKPAVINLSLGQHMGPHDGTSTFDKALDATVGAGRIVCGAAGNEGEYPLYSEATLAAGESHTFILDPSDQYYSGTKSFADFWGDEGQKYTMQIVYLDANGNELAAGTSTAVATATSKTTSWSNSTYASGSITAYAQMSTDATNNRGNVYLYFKNNFKPKNNYKVGFKVTAQNAGTIRVWGDDYNSIYWEDGQTTHTVGEIGGTANGIITVGAFVTNRRSGYGLTSVGTIATFSSKGPTSDGRMKPEITAPGACIASAVPNTSAITSSGDFDEAKSATVNGTTYYWGYMNGTSMATPFVTGVVATWLQANPNLTPEQIKEIMAQTAQTDSYTGTCPNNTWGYGKIDAYAGLLKVLETTDIKHLETLPDAIMLYPNPSDGAFKLFFKQNDNNVNIRIYAANGQQVYAQRIGAVDGQQTLDIDAIGIASGAYIVKIAGDNTNTTCRLIVR